MGHKRGKEKNAACRIVACVGFSYIPRQNLLAFACNLKIPWLILIDINPKSLCAQHLSPAKYISHLTSFRHPRMRIYHRHHWRQCQQSRQTGGLQRGRAFRGGC